MFDSKKRLYFLISYIYYSLKVPFEVRRGKVPAITAQVLWVLNRLGFNFSLPKILSSDYFETKFGKFFVTPDLISTYAVSPSFERLEMERLFGMIKSEAKNKKRILFIDIGAFFGLYTIAVGNKFKNYKLIDIVTFEPGTEYLSDSTLEILQRNIKINSLKKVTVNKYGIGSKNGKNSYGIATKPLDKFLNTRDFSKYDVVFIKLDIDDFVIDGLKGIQESVANFHNVYLLVEDFVKPKLVFPFLAKHGYKLIDKSTPYNSFWRYEL